MVFTQVQKTTVDAFINYGKSKSQSKSQKKSAKENLNKFAEELQKIHNKNKEKNLERVKDEINPIYNLYEGLDKLTVKEIESINKFLDELKNNKFGSLTTEEKKNNEILELFFNAKNDKENVRAKLNEIYSQTLASNDRKIEESEKIVAGSDITKATDKLADATQEKSKDSTITMSGLLDALPEIDTKKIEPAVEKLVVNPGENIPGKDSKEINEVNRKEVIVDTEKKVIKPVDVSKEKKDAFDMTELLGSLVEDDPLPKQKKNQDEVIKKQNNILNVQKKVNPDRNSLRQSYPPRPQQKMVKESSYTSNITDGFRYNQEARVINYSRDEGYPSLKYNQQERISNYNHDEGYPSLKSAYQGGNQFQYNQEERGATYPTYSSYERYPVVDQYPSSYRPKSNRPISSIKADKSGNDAINKVTEKHLREEELKKDNSIEISVQKENIPEIKENNIEEKPRRILKVNEYEVDYGFKKQRIGEKEDMEQAKVEEIKFHNDGHMPKKQRNR